MHFPAELLSSIFEHVRVIDHAHIKDDCATLPSDKVCPHASLKSLSLVCSTFRPLAQRELFSHITLRRAEGSQTIPPCNYLLDLIGREPAIASYIRGITIIDKQTFDGPRCHLEAPWIPSSGEVVAGILFQLPQLSNLHIVTAKTSLKWSQIPEQVLTAMYTVLQLPTFTSLAFTGFHDLPIDIIQRCPQLQDLNLFRSYFQHPCIKQDRRTPYVGIHSSNALSASNIETALPSPRPQIRHLGINETFPLCNFPFGCLNQPIAQHLQNLESFRIKCFLTNISAVPISQFTQLRRLHITCSPFMSDFETGQFIDLSQHQNLEVVEIGMTSTSPSNDNVRWVANTLNTIPTPNRSVQSVFIRLRVSTHGSPDQFNLAFFKELSLAFARLHHSTRTADSVLKTVVVDFRLNSQVEWDTERVRHEIAWEGCEEVFAFRMASVAAPRSPDRQAAADLMMELEE